MNEDMEIELTVADVNNLIEEIEELRISLDADNHLNKKEREDIMYFLAQYIRMLRKAKVIT